MCMKTLTAKLHRAKKVKTDRFVKTDRIAKHAPIEVGVKVEARDSEGNVTWGEVRSIDRTSPNARIYGPTAKLSTGKRVQLISCQAI